MGWGYNKWNNAALSSQTHVCCICRHIAKVCSYILYILYKSNSLKNGIKKKHHSNNFVSWLLVGCTKFHKRVPSGIWKVISSTWESIFFIYLKKNNIFLMERIYQLRNFDTNVKGCHLSFLLLSTYIYHHI